MKWNKCKKYKITVKEVAKLFGYKNINSFRHTGTFNETMEGVEKLIEIVEQKIIDKLK
jgi:hypothetical protein